MDGYIYEEEKEIKRILKLEKDDVIWVDQSYVIDFFPHVGQRYTFCNNGTIKQTILRSSEYDTKEYDTKEMILTKINLNNKKWWQFWIKRKPISFEFRIL